MLPGGTRCAFGADNVFLRPLSPKTLPSRTAVVRRHRLSNLPPSSAGSVMKKAELVAQLSNSLPRRRLFSYGDHNPSRRKWLPSWRLDAPYQRGGSSRHFTLAAAVIPDGAKPILNRPMRGLYTQRKRRCRRN